MYNYNKYAVLSQPFSLTDGDKIYVKQINLDSDAESEFVVGMNMIDFTESDYDVY